MNDDTAIAPAGRNGENARIEAYWIAHPEAGVTLRRRLHRIAGFVAGDRIADIGVDGGIVLTLKLPAGRHGDLAGLLPLVDGDVMLPFEVPLAVQRQNVSRRGAALLALGDGKRQLRAPARNGDGAGGKTIALENRRILPDFLGRERKADERGSRRTNNTLHFSVPFRYHLRRSAASLISAARALPLSRSIT